jgi:hypothetical protein
MRVANSERFVLLPRGRRFGGAAFAVVVNEESKRNNRSHQCAPT